MVYKNVSGVRQDPNHRHFSTMSHSDNLYVFNHDKLAPRRILLQTAGIEWVSGSIQARKRYLTTNWRQLQQTHGLDKWTLAFNKSRTSLGQCNFETQTIFISEWFLRRPTSPQQAMMTLYHEVAHAIAGYGAGHALPWQATVMRLGGEANTTAPLDRKVFRWVLECPDGCFEEGRYNQPRALALCGMCRRRLRRRRVTDVERRSWDRTV